VRHHGLAALQRTLLLAFDAQTGGPVGRVLDAGLVHEIGFWLAILATEFAWASHLLAHTRRRYDAVMVWFGRQGFWVRAAGVTLTTAVVLATLWMLGAVGWSAGLVGVDQPWLQSPLGLGGG